MTLLWRCVSFGVVCAIHQLTLEPVARFHGVSALASCEVGVFQHHRGCESPAGKESKMARIACEVCRPIAGLLAAVVYLVLPTNSVNAQVPSAPFRRMPGIEQWMRQYQARAIADNQWWLKYNPTGDQNGDIPPPIAWPPTVDGQWAPMFPPDGFYNESIRRDPHFETYLVSVSLAALAGGQMWIDEGGTIYYGHSPENYVKDTFSMENVQRATGENGNIVRYHVGPTDTQPADFLAPWISSTTPLINAPVTDETALTVFAALQGVLPRITQLAGAVGSRCVTNALDPDAPEATKTVIVDGAICSDLALATASAQLAAAGCWSANCPSNTFCGQSPCGWQTYGPPPNCPTCSLPGCFAIPEAYERIETRAVTGGYQVTITAYRHAARFDFDLRTLRGNFNLFVATTPLPDGGEFDTVNNLPIDDLYHHLSSFSGGGRYVSPVYGHILTDPLSTALAPDPAVVAIPMEERGWRILSQPYTSSQTGVFGSFLFWNPDFRAIEVDGSKTPGCSGCGSGMLPTPPKVATSDNQGTLAVDLSWALGVNMAGQDAGSMTLHLTTINPKAVRRSALLIGGRAAAAITSGASQTSISTGNATVVVTDWFANSADTEPSGIDVAIKQGSSTISTTALHVLSQQITDPNNPTGPTIPGNVLSVETTGQCPSKAEVREPVGAMGSAWEVATGYDAGVAGHYLRTERVTSSTNSTTNVRTNTTQVFSPTALSSVFTESSKEFPWGREVVERTTGLTGDGMGVHGVTYSYHEDATLSGSPNPNYSHLKAVTTIPEGAWKYYKYDAAGATVLEVAQFAGSQYGAAADTLVAEGRSKHVSFASGNPTGAGTTVAQITQVTERLKGVAVARTCTMSFQPGEGQFAGPDEVETWTIQCAVPEEPSGVAASLAPTYANPWTSADQVHVDVSEASGLRRIKRRMDWDGTLNVYAYTYDNSGSSPVRTLTIDSGPANAARTAVRGGTRTITTTNAQGIATNAETYEFDPNGNLVLIARTSVASGDIDNLGRVSKWTHFDGTTTRAHYDCCGKDYSADASGVKTWYVYDALKRETSSARQVGATTTSGTPVITTLTTYDADGRVLTQTRKGTDNTTLLLSSNGYDLGGRMIWTKNALNEQATYDETFASGFVVSTETMPDPDGTGSLSAPVSVRVAYPDGAAVSENVPFSASQSAAAPQQFSTDTTTLSGAGTVRRSYSYASDITPLSGAFPRTITYTNALGEVVRSECSLTSTTSAAQTSSYDPETHIRRQVDPDNVRTLTISGYGTQDAADYLGYTVPTALQPYFKCRWSLTALDVNSDDAITFSATSPNQADRITVTSSWLATRTVGATTVPVRHSATIVWNDDASPSSVIEVSSSDLTLDGRQGWSQSFQNTSSFVTTIESIYPNDLNNADLLRTITTTVDPSGDTAEVCQELGWQVYAKRTHAGSVFAGKTMLEYDAHGRVSKAHLLHTSTASLNGTDDDVTETTYDAVDRVFTVTAPSPNGGTGTSGGTRHMTTYYYDHLGRTMMVVQPNNKATVKTYTAQGQIATVRGFGTNPIDYKYDSLGRRTELTTYQTEANNSTKATTTWSYDPYSGRLLSKRYQGNNGTYPDFGYTYKVSGRPLTRATRRNIVTTYSYNSVGEPASTTYSDSTPAVLMTKRNRLGQVTEMADAAGRHTLSYLSDGRPASEIIESDSSIAGAPHTNHLAGTVLANTYNLVGGQPDRFPRSSTDATWGSTPLNHVDFAYDDQARIASVTKSDGRVTYTYDPITGRLITNSNKVNVSGYVGRFYGSRIYDRLGRLTTINWENIPPTTGGPYANMPMLRRTYTHDIYGRRTVMEAGIDEDAEDWAYGYDDKHQLTSAEASFSFSSPGEKIPGLQFGFAYDDIGNRTHTVQGDALTGSTAFGADYQRNPLNQYTGRDVPGKIEVSGHSDATTVTVNGNTAYRFMSDDGFFHDRVGVSNSAGPLRSTISIVNAPTTGDTTSYDVFVPAATEGFAYDMDGNLAYDGIWSYSWDAENRLNRMEMNYDILTYLVGQTNAGIAINFAYDGMGRRIVKQLESGTPWVMSTKKGDETVVEFAPSNMKKYVYDIGSWNLASVVRCNSVTGAFVGPDQSFAWGPDLSGTENGAGGIGGLAIYTDDYNDGGVGTTIGPMFPMYDGNGNVLRLYDGHIASSGLPDHKRAEYRYGPFGEQRGQAGSQASRFPFRWSTKFTDNETNLVYYGYRYYSASLGRWMSRDPVAEEDHSNLFCFVSNAPADAVDPFGLFGCAGGGCKIFLTFDDGPVPGTDDVLDVLKQMETKATFFVIGNAIRTTRMTFQNAWRGKTVWTGRDLVSLMNSDGHLVGNHSDTHAQGMTYIRYYSDPDRVKTEFDTTAALIRSILGADYAGATLGRLPGRNTWRTAGINVTDPTNDRDSGPAADALKNAGYKLFGWDAEFTEAEKDPEARRVLEAKIKSLCSNPTRTKKEGQVVILFHDRNHKNSTGGKQPLKDFIEYLKNQPGYTFDRMDHY